MQRKKCEPYRGICQASDCTRQAVAAPPDADNRVQGNYCPKHYRAYSPTTTGNGTGGTLGGGCTALGHTAIVNFLTDIGLGNDYPRAQLTHQIVTRKCIDVEGNSATMTAYWNELTGPNDEISPPTTTTTVSDGGQYDNTFVKVNGVGKADKNRVIFDTNITNYPCRN